MINISYINMDVRFILAAGCRRTISLRASGGKSCSLLIVVREGVMECTVNSRSAVDNMVSPFKNGFFTKALVLCAVVSTAFASCGGKPSNVIAINAGGTTNDYLLPCSGGYLLIDTAYEKHYNAFMEALGKKGIKPGEIKYLILTHHHDDHSGFAQRLLERTGARLIVHEKAYPFLGDGKPELKMKPLNVCTNAAFIVFTKFFKDRKDHSFPPVPQKGGVIVVHGNDDAILKSIGVNGIILHTPGHCDDSISMLMSNGDAYVGDAAMDMLNVCGCKRRPIWANDMKQVYESWRKLLKQGAKTIYSAHGDPFESTELTKTMNENPIR